MIQWLWLIPAFLFGWAVGVWDACRIVRKADAEATARAAIREADGLPVFGNPMTESLLEAEKKEQA